MPHEKSFIDPNLSNSRHDFPSILSTPPSLYLSIVVPAYNEEERLPIMIEETLKYLKGECEHLM